MAKGNGVCVWAYLPTPTHPQTPPLLNPTTLLLNLLHQLRHLLRRLPRIRRPRKEIPHLLLLLRRIGRERTMRQGLAVEEVRQEDLVLVGGVGVGEDVGALDGLRAVAEDVVDYEDGGGGG